MLINIIQYYIIAKSSGQVAGRLSPSHKFLDFQIDNYVAYSDSPFVLYIPLRGD
jgi:hypothetical protein